MRWQDGYPCDSGSTDGQDSARLAGIMSVFSYPRTPWLPNYVNVHGKYGSWEYLRHPVEGNKYKFSRDQAVCLFAGLKFQSNSVFLFTQYKPENGDFISPSVRDHFRICAGYKPTFLGQLWLIFDIFYMTSFGMNHEQNQILCMLAVHPKKFFLDLYVWLHPDWTKPHYEYWSGWRGEKELADHIIKWVEREYTGP